MYSEYTLNMCNYFTSNTKSINTYMQPLHSETIA